MLTKLSLFIKWNLLLCVLLLLIWGCMKGREDFDDDKKNETSSTSTSTTNSGNPANNILVETSGSDTIIIQFNDQLSNTGMKLIELIHTIENTRYMGSTLKLHFDVAMLSETVLRAVTMELDETLVEFVPVTYRGNRSIFEFPIKELLQSQTEYLINITSDAQDFRNTPLPSAIQLAIETPDFDYTRN